MKNNKVRSKKREYDTYSITMELEKPLLYEEEQEEIKISIFSILSTNVNVIGKVYIF